MSDANCDASTESLFDDNNDDSLLDSLGLPPVPAKKPLPAKAAPPTASSEPVADAEERKPVAIPPPPSPPPPCETPAVDPPTGGASAIVEPSPPAEYDGREQTYDQFRRLLGLPPSFGVPHAIPLPPIDGMAAVTGAMIMDAKRRRDEAAKLPQSPPQSSPATSRQPTAGKAVVSARADPDADDDLDGIDALTLEPGATRDVTKSPQHHKLQLDSWIPDDDDDDDDDDEAMGAATAAVAASASDRTPPPATVRVDARGAHAAAAAFAAVDDAVSEEEGDWADSPGGAGAGATAGSPPRGERGGATADSSPSSEEWLEVELPGKEAPAAAPRPTGDTPDGAAPPAEPPPPLAAEPTATQDVADATQVVAEEVVTAFSLDPDFDYDTIEQTERFSIQRALAEGEFYDRERSA